MISVCFVAIHMHDAQHLFDSQAASNFSSHSHLCSLWTTWEHAQPYGLG